MNSFNKFLLKTMCLIAILFFLFGCKQEVEIPRTDDDIKSPPAVEEPLNNVKFVNKTNLIVKVYTDSRKVNLLSEIKEKSSFSCKVDINKAGNVFYYKYYLVLENIQIPYGSGESIVDLHQDKLITINIPEPKELSTNENIVIMENVTESAIAFYCGENNELTPENKTSNLINSKEYGIYLLEDNNDLAYYNVFDAGELISLCEYKTDEKGFIFSFRYTGKDIVLYSKTPINLFIRDKIWKNSLSKTYGKDLVAGSIAPRENKEDGYMLFGSLSASFINDYIEGNVPYYAFMNANGEITKEYSLNFKDNPKSSVFYHCIEKNGIWLAAGKNRYEDYSDSLFIIGEKNGITFYQKIPSSSENSVTSNYKACGITHVANNTFCVLLGYEDDENESIVGGFELLEITIDDSNEVKTSVVYKTSEDDKNNNVIPCSILYNKNNYIVLSQNSLFEDSTISVIEKNSSNTFECNNKTLNSISLNKIKIYSIPESEEYLFLSGSDIDDMSGLDIATFGKIKIDDIKYIDTTNFEKFTGSNNLLNSNFYDFIVDEKGNIILGGFSCADYDYRHRNQSDVVTKNAVPFVVSYNLTQNKTNWEKEYTDQRGYVVYSVDKSSIDSLFLDLWNPSNRHSYIVSTGLLGEIPERTKLTLPHSSLVEEVEGDEITIKFYENSNSQTDYKQDVFKLGKEYTLEDFKQYEPANMCKVVGWYVLDKGNSTVNRNLYVYKPFYLSVHPMGSPGVKDEDASIEDDSVVEGEELVFPIKFTGYNITEINLYPKYNHSILEDYSYDENYHWNACICGYVKDKVGHSFVNKFEYDKHWQECDCGYTINMSEHTFSDWQKKDGKDVKCCSGCEFRITADYNTYVIYSASDLEKIRDSNYSSAVFELANDIDGFDRYWSPIYTFYGTLNGNGYTIKNFNIKEISGLNNHTAYCGFFYKNEGKIKNLFFDNITVNATFEYKTSDWRYVNVGTVAAANYGEINNVHLNNVTIKSNLNHKSNESFNDVRFINIVGGIVGKNYESINYCSIRKSSISASTDSKKNWCDSSTWVGGLCGENTKNCTNLLSISTSVSATTKGGYNWLIGNDGHLKCYAGCIFGFIKGSGNNSKIISYNNSKPQTYLVDRNKDDDDGYCNNIEMVQISGYIYGGNEQKEPDAYSIENLSKLDSYSSLINSWPNWSVTDAGPENYLDN